MAWLAAGTCQSRSVARARRMSPESGLSAYRRGLRWVRAEHAAFLLLVATGLALMARLGWGVGHPRWFGLKLGIVAFLLVPLEAMHGWIVYGWIEPGLRETSAPPFSKTLERGLGMREMLASLALPLLLLALPLTVWLSCTRPF